MLRVRCNDSVKEFIHELSESLRRQFDEVIRRVKEKGIASKVVERLSVIFGAILDMLFGVENSPQEASSVDSNETDISNDAKQKIERAEELLSKAANIVENETKSAVISSSIRSALNEVKRAKRSKILSIQKKVNANAKFNRVIESVETLKKDIKKFTRGQKPSKTYLPLLEKAIDKIKNREITPALLLVRKVLIRFIHQSRENWKIAGTEAARNALISSFNKTLGDIDMARRKLTKDGPLKRIINMIRRNAETKRAKAFWDKLVQFYDDVSEDMDNLVPYGSGGRYHGYSYDLELISKKIPKWVNTIKFISQKSGEFKYTDSAFRDFKFMSGQREIHELTSKTIDEVQDLLSNGLSNFWKFNTQKAQSACSQAISKLNSLKIAIDAYYANKRNKQDSKRSMLMLSKRNKAMLRRMRKDGVIDNIKGLFLRLKQKVETDYLPRLKKFANDFMSLPVNKKVKYIVYKAIHIAARIKQASSVKELYDTYKLLNKIENEIKFNPKEVIIENGEYVPNEISKSRKIAHAIALTIKGLKVLTFGILARIGKARAQTNFSKEPGKNYEYETISRDFSY